MRRFIRKLLRMRNQKPVSKLEPVLRSELVRGLSRKWIALRDSEIIEVQETPDALYSALHKKQISGATVIRVPGEHEPEMVGLG